MKKLIQNILNFLGYAVIKKKNFKKIYRTLDDTIKSLITKDEPIIFDVGAHKGESIMRFKKIFNKPLIHSFEPQTKCFDKLQSLKSSNIVLNNYGLGDIKENKAIHICNDDASSSILNVNTKSNFSKKLKIIDKEEIKIDKLDNYVKEKKINHIDLLKIDTQGYEENVILGGLETLAKKVFLIEIEIIFVEYYEKKNSFYKYEKILNDQGFELFSISSPNFTNNYRIKWLDALYINKSLMQDQNSDL